MTSTANSCPGQDFPNPSKISHNLRARRGAYTLLEIMIALAIIALLAGTAIPFFLDNSDQVDQAANDLRTFCRKVRAEAINLGEPRLIEVSQSALQVRGSDDKVEVPEGWTLEIRRSLEKKFRKPIRNELWEFNGEGLCEPIALRFVQGSRVYEMEFDPLTALEPTGG